MIQDKSTRSRMDLIMLMREKEFSVYTRMSFMLHLAYFKTHEEGDIIVEESWEMLKKGVTEEEFIDFLQTKYGLRHVLDMSEEELEEIQKTISAKGKH